MVWEYLYFRKPEAGKKELRMFNRKDIRQISKSQKVKSQKVYFSNFRFFEIQNEAFLLFNFSTFRNWKWHRSTFWLFDFLTFPNWQWSLSTFQLSTPWIFLRLVRLLVFPSQNCRLLREKDTSKKNKSQKVKECLHANTCYAWIPNTSKYKIHI